MIVVTDRDGDGDDGDGDDGDGDGITVSFSALEYLPSGHDMQTVCAFEDDIVPFGHGEQDLAPSTLPK